MSDTNETGDKSTKPAGRKSLSLRRSVDSGTLKQSLSQGRSRSVVVEKRRKRPIGAADGKAPANAKGGTERTALREGERPRVKPTKDTGAKRAKPAGEAADAAKQDAAKADAGSGNKTILRTLTSEEKEARARALELAKEREAERQRDAALEAEKQAADAATPAPEAAPTPEVGTVEIEAETPAPEADAQPAVSAEEAVEPAPAEEPAAAAEDTQTQDAPAEAPEAASSEPITPFVGNIPKWKLENDARKARQKEEAEKQKAEEAAKAAKAPRKAGAQQPAADPAQPVPDETDRGGRRPSSKPSDEEDTLGGRVKRKSTAPSKPSTGKRDEPRRRTGKLTITAALDDGSERVRSLAAMRRAREREKRAMRGEQQAPQKVQRDVTIPETITIRELADRMATRSGEIIKYMMKQGSMVTVNDTLDADTAQLIAEEFGHSVKRVAEADVEIGILGTEDVADDLVARAPVVTVMGHVDHGKTSLLDALRQSDVVAGEAGGITQHIGAYQVQLDGGSRISFLDTPGHAAFTAMRARGAQVTDIVILVVAADDGVMPQTAEAIAHAKAAEVPIIVAINKIDKPDADPSRVKNDLLQHELIVEEMGGDVQAIPVSATEKTGLQELEEAVLLQSEILELKANPNRPGIATVVEARLDKGRGSVATVLVQNGTVKLGDIFVTGQTWGRVRALINDRGEQVQEAGPALPVEVLGLQTAPMAGDDFVVVESEAKAREIAEYRERKARDLKSAAETQKRGGLEQMLQQLKETDAKEYPVVVKADVQGSVEAILGALDNLSTEEVRARALHSAVGGITESDVVLAAASNAPIFGFNVRANAQARELATRDGVEIRYYAVIYDLVDDVKAAMSGLLDPTLRETFLGNAEILEVFNISKVGKVAGCRVTEGMVRRGAKVRLIRDSVVIHEGSLSTLKRFKDEVKEVQGGQECGMAFENYQDIQPGDVIECFEVESVERTL
ncbi:MAG: translation initiation factor IF-2 [Pseudomonadota bacterium]